MPRTSLVHYIAPSSISLMPNCNGSANDIDVYLSDGAKIRVYSKKAGIDIFNSTYQEWTLNGRNRRLADSAAPYTIYARLSKNDKSNGYLIFTKKELRNGEWIDKYPSVTVNGLSSPYYGTPAQNCWYIRLGDVSLPEDGKRVIDLDTGILGTEEYNASWNLTPDDLPLRVEMSCAIDGEDAGPTPYVYWGQSAVLSVSLVEGWLDAEVPRFDHWEIRRNSGSDSDSSWPSQQRQTAFASSGSIVLSHTKGSDDDFASAVSALYTVIAWGRSENPDDQTLVSLATVSINIHAETVEKYEMSCSTEIVSYNPQSESYTPAGGVAVRFRATDQRGDVFLLTKKQFDDSGITVSYAPVGSSSWQQLTPAGASTAVATVTVPVSAFASQQSVNVRLQNSVGQELATKTIAFVRDGEDSNEREWIFFRSADAITFGDLLHPYPSNISYGEVEPTGAAGHVTDDKNQDGWVPETWWDEMRGTDEQNRFEYGAYRDFVHDETNGDHWGDFTTPKIWGHYGKDGEDGKDGKSVARLVMERTLLTVKTDNEGRTIADVSTIIPFSVILDNMPLTIVETSIEEGGTTHYVTLGKVIYSTHDDVVLDGRSVDIRDHGYLQERGIVLDDGFYIAESDLKVTIPRGTILDEHLTLISVTCTDDNGTEYQCGEVLEIAGIANGKNAYEPLTAYQWSTSPSEPPSPLPNGESLGQWSKTAPNRPAVTGEYYLWMTQTTKHIAADGTVTIDPWQPAVRISGNNGSNGEDGTDYEYIYILKTTQYTFPTNEKPANISAGEVSPGGHAASGSETDKQLDDWVPNGWWDNPQGIDSTNKFEYMSLRIKPKGSNTWGAFSDPILWSRYGHNGIDGDGVEYVYIRTKQAVAPVLDTTQTGYGEAEFLPTITNKDACEAESNRTTDDALGVDATYRYEWMAKRTMTAPDADGQRTWTKFQGSKINGTYDYKMSLWAYRPENITKKSETAYYITDGPDYSRPAENDQRWNTTKPSSIQKGYWLYTKTVITWSDDSHTYLYTDERNPADGAAGQDIVVDGATVMKYSCKDSNTIDPETINDWDDYGNVTKVKGQWLWSKATTYYKKADSAAGSHDAGSSINYNVSYIATDGTSPYFADIDNEMDSVACDYQGNILADYDTYVGVHIWHGSTEQSITTLTTNSITGITITPDAANKRIRVQIAAGTNIATVNAITITIASFNSGNKTLHFTLNGVRPGVPGEEAVIYSLLPSTNSISKKKDGSYVPAGTSYITCAVQKRIGNGDLVDAPASEYTLKYKKDNDSQESVFPAAGIRINTIESTIQFILYDKASTPHVIDRERVPVVADGSDGRAITATTEHYKVSNNDGSADHQEAKPIPDGQENANLEWTTDPNEAIASWGENAKYLWNYEKAVYSSGTTPVRTTPRIIAIWTEDGRGIDSIVNKYCITNSATAPLKTDTSVGWDDDPMAPTEEEPYLWNYEYIVWTDGTNTSASAVVHLLGHYGADGTNSATLHLEQSNVFVPTDKNNAIVVESGNNYIVEIPFYVIAGGEALAHYSAQLQEGGTTHYATLGGAGVWDVSGNVFTREGTGVNIEGAYISGRGIVLPDGTTFAPSTVILTFPKNGVLDEHRVNLTVVALDSDSKEYTVFGTIEIKGRRNGEDGYNTASVMLYQRYAPTQQAPTPAKPNGTLTYTFSSGVLSGTGFNGWTQTIPAMEPNTKLFVTMATAHAKEATDTIAANEWATPVEYVTDGKNGSGVIIKGNAMTTDILDPNWRNNVLQGIVLLNSGNDSVAEWDEEDEEWYYYDAAIGDCYIVTEDKHLYEMQADGWHDLGKFVGDDGIPGKNTVRLSLDNEHEDFIYNDAGTCIAPSGGAKSVVRLYDGETELASGFTLEVDFSKSSGVPGSSESNKPTISNGVLTVPHLTANTAKIVVKATYKSKEYFADFTGNKTSQDKYELKLTPNAIAFNSSETWADKTITPSAERTDLQGNKTTGLTIQTTATDGLRLYYSYVKTDGTLLDPSLNLLTTATFSLTQTPSNTYIGIYFELRLYSGNNFRMCDNETVEIAKTENGADGLSAASVVIYKRSVNQPSETAGSRDVPDNNSRYYFKTVGSGSSRIKAGSLVPPTGGSLNQWSLAIPSGSAPLWSRQASALALATADYDTIEDSEWSTAEKVVENGEPGESAVNVIVSPASLIVNQSLDNPSNLDSLSEQILFSVEKGSTQLPVTAVSNIVVEQDAAHNNRNKIAVSGSNSYIAMLTAILKNADTNGKYYDQAYFTCKVAYTDGGTTKYIENVKVKVYANLLGDWSEKVEGDTKTEVARSLTYGYDPTSGSVISLENFGQYIKSSEENVSRLTKTTINTVFSDGKWVINANTFVTADFDAANKRWYEEAQSWNDIYSPVVFLSAGTYCFSGYFLAQAVFDPGNNIAMMVGCTEANPSAGTFLSPSNCGNVSGDTIVVNGSTYQKKWATFIVGQDAYCSINLWDSANIANVAIPMLNKGTTPSSDTTMSVIRQTADEIDLSITNKLGQTGINIQGSNREINLIAGKVNFCNSSGTAQTYVQITSDGKINATDGEFSGKITATDGAIGGFAIGEHKISSSGDSPKIVLNDDGTATIGNMSVADDGKITATGVDLTGKITATSGSITGQMNIVSGGSLMIGSTGQNRIEIKGSSSGASFIGYDANNNEAIKLAFSGSIDGTSYGKSLILGNTLYGETGGRVSFNNNNKQSSLFYQCANELAILQLGRYNPSAATYNGTNVQLGISGEDIELYASKYGTNTNSTPAWPNDANDVRVGGVYLKRIYYQDPTMGGTNSAYVLCVRNS